MIFGLAVMFAVFGAVGFTLAVVGGAVYAGMAAAIHLAEMIVERFR